MKLLALVVGGVCILALLAVAVHYVFIDTLLLSEVLPPEQGRKLFGFILSVSNPDTGLTRWDTLSLRRQARSWEARAAEIEALPDASARQAEYQRLTADILQDPTVRKAVEKVMSEGRGNVLDLLGRISRRQ